MSAEVIEAWLRAKCDGDHARFKSLLAQEFRGVGPPGFILDRDGWIGRHAPDKLRYSQLELAERQVRRYGPVEIVVGVQHSEGEWAQTPINQHLHISIVLESRHICHVQMSPIGEPPQEAD